MGFFFSDDDESWNSALRNIAENQNMYEQIGLPSYDEYTPELYNDESYNYELLQEDPSLLSRQGDNLNILQDLASKGLGAEDELAFQKARDVGAQAAKSGTQAAIADANNRGVGGGGMEFAMREIANQGGAERAQNAGLEQAAAAARQRALNAQAYQNAMGQVRGQNYQTAAANNNIINQFNSKNTQQRNQTNAANVDQRNNAFMYNQGLKDKNYQNQLDRADRRAGINNQRSETQLARADQQRRSQQADINQFMSIGSMGLSAYGKGKDDE